VSEAYHGIQVYDKLAHISYSASYQSVVINYISEHQLSHAIDASHTTPIYVSRGPILLKLIGWRIVCGLSGSRNHGPDS